MIVYRLACKNEHVFDVWFKDGRACDDQVAGRKVVCPECGSRRVAKAMMAPRVKKSEAALAVAASAPVATSPSEMTPVQMGAALRELRRHVEANCEHVGDRFAEEARKIHKGERERRDIYGEATQAAAEALIDDGIEVNHLPWVPLHDA
ncbi:MAG: DUF1178 family protein [Alphaproteobacteria bacterium]|nr:DUF1178 family protein [Alphaproteobacteria bacterium]